MTALWLDRILIATDLSPPSEAVFGAVQALAVAFEPKLTVLHVRDARSAHRSQAPLRVGEIQARIDEMRSRLLRSGAAARTTIVLAEDRPGPTICAYARDHHYDLIAIGTRGSSPCVPGLMGRVAEHVLHHAGCPVLCVRPAA